MKSISPNSWVDDDDETDCDYDDVDTAGAGGLTDGMLRYDTLEAAKYEGELLQEDFEALEYDQDANNSSSHNQSRSETIGALPYRDEKKPYATRIKRYLDDVEFDVKNMSTNTHVEVSADLKLLQDDSTEAAEQATSQNPQANSDITDELG